MKKLLLLASLVCLIAFLCGCSASLYNLRTTTANDTTVNIDEANFRVIDTVSGTATTARVLGIGGLSSRAIKENAYAEMLIKANLKGSQIISNVTYDIKMRGVPPIYWKTRVTAYGLILEFVNPQTGEPVPARTR